MLHRCCLAHSRPAITCRLAAARTAGCSSAVRARPFAAAASSGSDDETPHALLNTVVLIGSTRAKRVGHKVAAELVTRLEERGGHYVTVLDPREHGDGFFMRLMEKAHFHYKADEDVPAALEETAALLRAADAFVVVTPEMNHTISPGLANMMNYFGSKVCNCRSSPQSPVQPLAG